MSADPIKCLAAAHLPLTRRKKEDADWPERVDALAKDIREFETATRKDERAKVLFDVRSAFNKSAGDWDYAWFLVFGDTWKEST